MSVNAVSDSLKEMLTSCPKCGFSQPKDQYCAQCGVDMLAYRPPKKPLWKRAFENLTVQIFFIFLLGAGAIYFIKQNHRENFWSRVQFLRGSGPQVSRSKEQNLFSAPQAATEEEVVAGVTETAEPAPPTQASLAAESKPEKKPETIIRYMEIPTAILSKWLEDGVLTRVETSEGVTIAYIPQLDKALETVKDQVKVVKEESFNYAVNQLYAAKLDKPAAENPATTRVLAQEPPKPVLTAYATIDDDRNDMIVGQLEVSTGPQSSIPALFEMSPDQSFFMSGFSKSKNSERTPDSELVVILQIKK